MKRHLSQWNVVYMKRRLHEGRGNNKWMVKKSAFMNHYEMIALDQGQEMVNEWLI